MMDGTLPGIWKRVGRLLATVSVLLSGLPTVASGHDLWLEADPAAKPASKPEERALHLRSGERFVGQEEKPLQKDSVSRFDLFADGIDRRDLLAAGRPGQTPVAKIPALPGAGLAVMDRREHETTLDHDKFNRYLADEGQDAILAQRARLGQTDADGKDIHTHYLKALIPGTDPASTLPNTLYKRRVGQRLEILLQNNPNRLPASRKLTIKVLFEGEPLVGAKVFAYPRDPGPENTKTPGGNMGTSASVMAITTAGGLADFKLDQNGLWLVRMVHMRASAERKSNPGGVWESFWGSYSFVARGTAPANPTMPVTIHPPGTPAVESKRE